MEIHWLSVTLLIKLQNDAISYCDRMIVSLTTLCCRFFEEPDNNCKLQENILLKMVNNIQTALGISKQTNKN